MINPAIQMKKPLPKARGVILIMTAVIIVILIGIAAFALDIGRLYVLHTEMQNAVDAGAISAAAELDGESGARERAMSAANQEMLNHLAHFSGKNKLLEGLPVELEESGIFTFYSWIGSEFDLNRPDGCAETESKCEASGDDDANYVRIWLDPELFADSDGRYEIDLYFLPVLSVLGIETPDTASTRVMALAGSHYEVCNYPPMMICDPSQDGNDLNPGEMVVLKEHSGSWGAGTFGWLEPTKVAEDPDDDKLSGNKLLARRLGSIYGQACSPPIVEINPGAIANWPRWGLNTRFGIYETITESAEFPSAPNVIDYPRDDDLTLKTAGECVSPDYTVPADRFGDGSWDTTECHSDSTLSEQQPSTYSENAYIEYFHNGAGPTTALATRYEYYNWELSLAGNLAENTITKLHANETQCANNQSKNCRMLKGDPSTATYVDVDDTYKRRELFVAAINCGDDFNPSSSINIEDEDGKWMRFFLTEHVDDPSQGGVNIYAEFIEEATIEEDEHFKKVIQLYE